ncbi:UDP-glucosyltransferase 2-like [Colias croceus]|uniref:UDP-glucosyltransferase 2-like n=1 Tax=Colias crocea TaxID=72248 RepID=UPI001E27F349|nr:UDP-glucosyltransferase 2-like [Colias croceus]
MLCVIWLLSLHFILGESARILGIFPSPHLSHQIVFRPLMHALAQRGHDVIVITTDPAFPNGGGPSSLKEVNIHNVTYPYWRELMQEASKDVANDIFSQIKAGRFLVKTVFAKQVQSDEVQNVIKSGIKFDLILIEAYFRPALGLAESYKCPIISISSFGASYGNYEKFGAPTHALLYPNLLRQRLNNLTLFEELNELYTDKIFHDNLITDEIEYNSMNKALFPNAPDLAEVDDNIQMLFINTHPVWERIRPVPRNVVYISGILDNHSRSLPRELQSYLDSSKNGVIYVSFGTSVSTKLMSPFIVQMFVNVFSKLPYEILWKWDDDVLPGITDNIKIAKWWPQTEILKHPNVKLFITQGGLSSSFESISAGVPLVGIPMLFDQWYNVENYEYYGIGIKLDLTSLTEEKLRHAVETVIKDASQTTRASG